MLKRIAKWIQDFYCAIGAHEYGEVEFVDDPIYGQGLQQVCKHCGHTLHG